MMARDEFVHEDGSGDRFRFIDDGDGVPTYLQCVDDRGTRYRNGRRLAETHQLGQSSAVTGKVSTS